MTAPMPTPRALKMHARMHPEHKYRARLEGGGVVCAICRAEADVRRRQNRGAAQVPGPEATPAGFVTHEGGTIRTQALAPGVGITLGQLAHFVAMARDMAGMADSSRIDIIPEAKRRNRPGQRIRAMVIAPAPRAEEVEDAA